MLTPASWIAPCPAGLDEVQQDREEVELSDMLAYELEVQREAMGYACNYVQVHEESLICKEFDARYTEPAPVLEK